MILSQKPTKREVFAAALDIMGGRGYIPLAKSGLNNGG
jgi:hypothetical protein